MAARRYEISLRVLKNISIVFWCERCKLLRSYNKGDIFTCENIMFSRESSAGISLVFI